MEERSQTGGRDHGEIEDRIDGAAHLAVRAEFRRGGQDVVEDSQELMVIADLDIAASGRRSEGRLLLEHLSEVHEQDRVGFDQLLEFADDRMKGFRFLFGDFRGFREPGVQMFTVGGEPAAAASRSFVVSRHEFGWQFPNNPLLALSLFERPGNVVPDCCKSRRCCPDFFYGRVEPVGIFPDSLHHRVTNLKLGNGEDLR